MKKLTLKENYNLINALVMLDRYILIEDLCSDGKDIYHNWTNMIEKELRGLLDDNFQIELESYGIATIPNCNVEKISLKQNK